LDLADVFFFEEIFPIVWLASYNDDWPSSSHISDWLLGESRHLAKWFPANMPWPMTLAPTNEAISREF
jgi:hypothetical protein